MTHPDSTNSSHPQRAKDQVWLVTGASAGLGRATAKALAAEGATVVLLARTTHKLESCFDEIVQAGHAEPAIYPLNLAGASMDDYLALAEQCTTQLGGLHGIVHAAAHFDGLGPLSQHPGKSWAASLHVNLTAPMLLTQACLPAIQANAGRILFIGDAAGADQRAFWGAYGLSKSAVQHMAQMWAAENGDAVPVDVRHFTPPPMRTGLRQLAFPSEPADTLASPEAVAQALLTRLFA